MKKSLLTLSVGFCCIIYAQEFPDLKGEYLGQTPPGDTPEVFAREIISDKYQQHGTPAISPDGIYLFFTRDTPGFDEDVYWVSSNIIERLREKNNIKK